MSIIFQSKLRAHAQLVGGGALANKAMHGHAWEPVPSTLVVGIRTSLQGCPWLSKIVRVYNLHGIWITRDLDRFGMKMAIQTLWWQTLSRSVQRILYRQCNIMYPPGNYCNISHLRKIIFVPRRVYICSLSKEV